jgi:thermitase
VLILVIMLIINAVQTKITAVVCAMTLVLVPGAFAQTVTAVPDQILARPGGHLSETAVQAVFAVQGASQIRSMPQLNVRVLQVPAASRDRVLEAMKNNPNIEFAEVNGLASAGALTNDPYVTNGSEWHVNKIQAADAWGITSGNASTIIAICDTGVAPTQPDLVGKLLPGYNFYANNTDTSDDYGHGSAVAGTAAAQGNNGIGVAGIAWGASILPVKISDPTGYATYADMADALTYAVDHGARVINISFYGSSSSTTLETAADYVWSHNGMIFACAGNLGTSAPQYPAACQNVTAVSATDSYDLVTTFSNYGSNISLSAPGSGIWTTNRDGTYSSWSGTSFASPIAAGAAALLVALNPALTNSAILDLLKNNSDDLGSAGYDIYYGYGRVNAYRALLAAGAPPPIDTIPPVTSITSPAAGSTVSGSVTVPISATDNVGVTKVELYLDGALSNVTSQLPASFTWNTLACADGIHTLHATGYDSAGNAGASVDVSVTVQNTVATDKIAPTAQITSPLTGTIVGKTQKVYPIGSDNIGVTRIELYLDGALVGSSTNSAPMFNLNTKSWATGAHTLQSLAFDAAGNAGASALVNVTK